MSDCFSAVCVLTCAVCLLTFTPSVVVVVVFHVSAVVNVASAGLYLVGYAISSSDMQDDDKATYSLIVFKIADTSYFVSSLQYLAWSLYLNPKCGYSHADRV